MTWNNAIRILWMGMLHLGQAVDALGQPGIEWQRTFGGSDFDQANDVQQTKDGGYIIAGNTLSFDGDVLGNHGGTDFWVLKLNGDGQLSWKKTFGGPNNDGCYEVLQTSDGGYILTGYTYSNSGQVSGNHGDIDAWIVKLSATGGIQWQKCFGGTKWDEAWSIVETLDGGFAFAGFTSSSDGDVSGFHGGLDFWVVKISAIGDIMWQKAIGGTDIDQGYVLKHTDDGGLIIAGESESSNGDISEQNLGVDYWVVKMNSVGDIEWERLYGGLGLDRPYDIWQSNDGSFVVFGQASFEGGDVSQHYGGYDWWLVKLNSVGELVWEKNFGGSEDDFSASVYGDIDGGYMLAGSTKSNDWDVLDNDGGAEFFLVKVDSVGSIAWQKTYGGTSGEYCYAGQQTTDGGYITAGLARSNNGDVTGVHGLTDFWIVKLAPETSSTSNPSAIPLNLYPNPAQNWFSINLPITEADMQISIADALGRVVLAKTVRSDERMDISELTAGVYTVSVVSRSGQLYTGKLMKE